jgi:integrase
LRTWISQPGFPFPPFKPKKDAGSKPLFSLGQTFSIGLELSAYGTHSMRRTKVAQIYKKTGDLRAVQLLLGHTKMDSTVRYLGVELEDALAISEGVEI